MTIPAPDPSNFTARLAANVRLVRARYDELTRGATASLRRCRTASEVVLESNYWRVGDEVARAQHHLAHVVLLFPFAPHTARAGFSFGRYLRNQLRQSPSATLRFRRLLDARDRDELDHRLRGILKLAGAERAPLDWGVLGTDVLWFFAASDGVRRRWAQGFYAPTADFDATDSPAAFTATADQL